ncbi:hypothetical protein ED733_008127 [Metarhizium rileyi]|uniref:DUF676 domain-containing protein n=1 Tax=Metarhizium rileyi (strain RCEF 4871) TaxID=1649241 RepID=A0A5C6GIE0_METRR|nr:hypothetical protein ED733_008127 [Metarhizium rileyi]
MLLLNQVGSVKIGEVVRYTITYTPSQDRILPSPEKLYVRVRNTSTIALRAAFVHGPYTLSVSAYPSNYKPNEKFPNPRRYGVPKFEPMLKAGGSWECELVVPDDIRQAAGAGRHGGFGKSYEHDDECASWIIELASQVMFSTSAAVGFEVVVARDHKSLNLSQSLPIVGNASAVPQPGRISDHQQSIGAKDGHHPTQAKGVFSRAVHLKVEDTATLWNTPRLPGWDDVGTKRVEVGGADQPVESVVKTGDSETSQCKSCASGHREKPKVHLVILTHGLHSNLGADMLYIKESIDAAAKQARIDAKARRAKERAANLGATAESRSDGAKNRHDGDDNDDDEEVIVRGYSGNATKTEKGIKYLGKRLSRYILSMTYPDQPFLPVGKGAVVEGLAGSVRGEHGHQHQDAQDVKAAHKHSTVQTDFARARHDGTVCRHYKITSISFVGHSLGGLIQMYAIAYIQKHSPHFFELVQPVNFISLASPFLGLSNENPLYVKFALDFGLVGRTGQDLGLTWRAPTIARSGWGAIVSNLGESAHKKVYGESQPESKPLLRILPTGPAHTALKKFRNRTVYSNVVNDGIVPLRTSCLLFLDWQGLGRVEKARRDAGLVETVVGFGWAELTGTNMLSPRPKQKLPSDEQAQQSDSGTSTPRGSMRQVPQPSDDAIDEDDRASIRSVPRPVDGDDDPVSETTGDTSHLSPLAGFFNLFKSNEPPKPQITSEKQRKMLRRGQTMPLNDSDTPSSSTTDVSDRKPGKATTGHEMEEAVNGMTAPPKTTFFESAGDLLNPSMPTTEYLLDPSKRPRTIFHDRVYHPSDIPPPPMKKRQLTLVRRKTSGKAAVTSQQSAASDSSLSHPSVNHADSMESTKDYDDLMNTNPDKHPDEVIDGSSMRVEEKIARGYHRDLSWRKVLVKLEPDAHNNIIVRRMFANAHGWPVIKHLVDAHFSDSEAARMRDDEEPNVERAFASHRSPDADGREVKRLGQLGQEGVSCPGSPKVSGGGETNETREAREALDEVPELPKKPNGDVSSPAARTGSSDRADSMSWSERDWVDSENESDLDTHGDAKVGRERQQGAEPTKDGMRQERLSPPAWRWAERIVGKGSSTRSRSKSPKPGEDR